MGWVPVAPSAPITQPPPRILGSARILKPAAHAPRTQALVVFTFSLLPFGTTFQVQTRRSGTDLWGPPLISDIDSGMIGLDLPLPQPLLDLRVTSPPEANPRHYYGVNFNIISMLDVGTGETAGPDTQAIVETMDWSTIVDGAFALSPSFIDALNKVGEQAAVGDQVEMVLQLDPDVVAKMKDFYT